MLIYVSCGNRTPPNHSIPEKIENKTITPTGITAKKDMNQKMTVTRPAKTTHRKKYTAIARFSTQLLDLSSTRIFNIEKAAMKINTFILKPGCIFSFNAIVGNRTSETGYKDAKIIVHGKREKGNGGGICQLSSTLYNAVLKVKLPILERHNHTGKIHYLPIGRDAAVSYGHLDFKFKNNQKHPLKFQVYIHKGYLKVVILQEKGEA